MKRMVTNGIHEAIKQIPWDSELGLFKNCIKELLNIQDKQVREALVHNLDSIIQSYAK